VLWKSIEEGDDEAFASLSIGMRMGGQAHSESPLTDMDLESDQGTDTAGPADKVPSLGRSLPS
jgi:hypothetical protein